MAKFLSRLFSSGSSSSKAGSFRGSHSSINENSRRTGGSSNMRPAASLENLSSYHINPKELDKHKLHKASWEGNLHKVERLAGPGQINQKDQQARTALHLAVVKGHLEIVKYLVHEGAQLNVLDNELRTPLVKAVLSGNQNPRLNYEICRILLMGGADAFINAVDTHGKNALHYAIDFGNEELVGLFLSIELCDPNFRDRDQMTPLHLAVKRNNPNIVYLLLSDEHVHQADPNLLNRNGQTPLHMAASVGYVEIIRVLLQANLEEPCDPTIVDPQQLTAYQIAKANHHETCAKLIDEYQQGWTKLSPRRDIIASIHEQEINPILMNPSRPVNDNQDESTDDSSSNESSRSSETFSEQRKQSSNQWSDRTVPSTNGKKQETRTLADIIKNNPLQPETTKSNISAPTNQTLASLMQNIPLQRDIPETTKSNISVPANQTLASLLQNIPLQRDIPETTRSNVSAPTNQTLASLMQNIPLQRDTPVTNTSKPNNQTLSSLVQNIPLQTNEASNNKPITPQQKQPPSIFGIGPVALQHKETDNTSTSISIEKSLTNTNRLVGQTATTSTSPQKNTTINSLVNSLPHPQPIVSNSSSWTNDSKLSHQREQPIKQATRMNTWDDSSTTQSDDDDTGIYHTKTSQTSFPKPQTLNSSAMFTTTTAAAAAANNDHSDDSKSDEDSIEAAIQRLNTQKAAGGIQNLVNKQIGNNFKAPQSTSILNKQSPLSEDSSWTTSSVTANKESTTKGIYSLIQQQPLLPKKSSEPTWDDSRPLSADLKRTTNITKSQTFSNSDDSDVDQDKKSSTIVKSPFTNSVLTNLVSKNIQPTETSQTGVENLAKIIQKNMQPTEPPGTGVENLAKIIQKNMQPTETPGTGVENLAKIMQRNMQPHEPPGTGVENLVKIIQTMMYLSKPTQKQSTSPTGIGKLIVSPLIQRNDSMSSNASSLIDDTVRSLALTTAATINTKQHLYTDGTDHQHWSEVTSDSGHDFKFITRNYSNEMIQQSQRQTSRASMQHDFNNLRGSMSSSTSSIQNNMERISELKEDIKQIERKQEDSLELKRQLKDMEIKKNNFEALYKKNDQLLRETETKLEKEINEKQRLEWATKNLNMELKSVKQKLQSLEDEKNILNQRCIKLKEERDNFDEKLRIHQANTLQTATAGVLREEDIEKIKFRHREEMKLLSAENEDLHQRMKQLQSDLQLHRESLDVTVRYKIELEKALEEKTFLQHELDRLKHEKDFIEQEKLDYKIKNDNLQEEIRSILLDRSKLEQKLTNELQEQIKQRQRSTDDIKKYKIQIEQLNIKLGDAEARLLVLQTQNEALIASKDRNIKNEFESLTHRLNIIESEKINAEQRYHNEHKQIADKQQQQSQHILHEPLVILTPTPLTNAVKHQHSPSTSCVKCDTLQRSYEQEREQRLQTEKDNERLRDVVSRQNQQQQLNKSFQQHQENEHIIAENSKQMRTDTERVKYELDRLRHDFDKLVLNYDPLNNLQQQAQIHSQIDTLRQFYENEFRQKQLLISKLPNGNSSIIKHEHSLNGNFNCLICSNSRLLKERLDNAIDTSLADQRIQTIKQIPILPRQTTPLITTNTYDLTSVDLLRKRYYM